MFEFLPKPKTIAQAQRQTLLWERAQQLTAQGYRLEVCEFAPAVRVYKPGNNDTYNPDYVVNTDTWTCTCEYYCAHLEEHCCKHNLAAHAAWDRAMTLHLEAQATEAEELIRNGWSG